MSSIRLDGIHKSFGDVQALRGVDLDVPDGCFFVLVGPSGAGKTTTLRVIAGLDRPDQGSVSFDGMPAGKATPAERDVAMVFQSYALYPKLTVARNIASPLRARRISAEEIDRRVREVAEVLGIERLLDRKPAQLSGGEQQRVALGRALVREPRAFLMDEPLTNLDLKRRVEMRAELINLHRGLARTFLYVTNDQVEAMSMADRIAVLREGQLQQVGTPDEIYGRPVNRFVATFIGAPRMNLLRCRLEDDALVGHGWSLPAPQWWERDRSSLELGVRPEDLSIGGAPDQPGLAGLVYAVEPLGDRSLVDIKLGEGLVKVRARPTVSFEVGEPLRVGIDMDRVHLFDAETGEVVRRREDALARVPAPEREGITVTQRGDHPA
jgi:multiple sugar transport system ATP-binding protein